MSLHSLLSRTRAITFTVCFVLALTSAASAQEVNVSSASSDQSSAQTQVVVNGNVIGQMNLVSRNTVSARSLISEQTVTENYAATVEITPDGEVSVLSGNSSETHSDENTYWRATATITYTVDSTLYGRLISVSGSWLQLHGVTTLSNRDVYYAQHTGTLIYNDKYPTSNSFYYNTNFSSAKLIWIGCTTSADITTQAGYTISLETSVSRDSTNLV